MRSLSACVILVAIALTIIAEPAMAEPSMSIPFVTTPQFVFFRPSHLPALTIIETNTSSLAASDTEAFALSFPPAGNPLSSGFNIAPAIAQTSSRTIAASRSYTFQDFVTV